MNSIHSLYTALAATPQFNTTLTILITLSPLFLMFVLLVIFAELWVNYVRAKNYLSVKRAVLEVRLPKDTFKSPLAMEVVLQALHNTADGGGYAQYWQGKTRPWYSLEIASIEGQVKFYIWAEDDRKQGVMNALYSQYPGIEVHEVADYTRGVHYDPARMKMWACEFEFTKDDPYPIKTYVDYGLDKDPKEEFKIDPMAPMIEFLGSLGPNQSVWIQLIIRAHKDDQRKPGHLFKKTDLWKDKAEELIHEILKRDPDTKVSGVEDEESGLTKKPTIAKHESDIAEAIGRSIAKMAFDVGIRTIYMSSKESYSTPFGAGGIIASFKHFNTENLNGFKPNGETWTAQLVGKPWEDFRGRRRNLFSHGVLMAYKRRSFFYPPFKGKSLVMNSEELATVYHFPGSVVATPTLDRVPSKKGVAPGNLPV